MAPPLLFSAHYTLPVTHYHSQSSRRPLPPNAATGLPIGDR